MTLTRLMRRLRAAQSFNGFRAGGTVPIWFLTGEVTWDQIRARAAVERRDEVHQSEAQETLDDLRALKTQIAQVTSTIPPARLRRAEAKARQRLIDVQK